MLNFVDEIIYYINHVLVPIIVPILINYYI